MSGSGRYDDLPSYQELLTRTDRPGGSAWGLFGEDDEIGTLNLLTPERVRAATACVRTGERFSLDLPLDAFRPALIPTRKPIEHEQFASNPFHRDDRVDSFYPQSASQLDGLRHIGHPDHGFYNGADPERFSPAEPLLGINRYAEHGIVGRGVLLDVGRHLAEQGVPLDHSTNHPVPVSALEDTARVQGVELRRGDILMIRFGWVDHVLRTLDDAGRAALVQPPLHCPGLAQQHEIAAWLWDHGFSVVAGDNFALEAWPPIPGGPFLAEAERRGEMARSSHTGLLHRVLIPLLGFAIGELWALDELAAACARDGVYDCLVVAAPLQLVGGAGSPSNAVAIR
jgi:kynurenine formamidase